MSLYVPPGTVAEAVSRMAEDFGTFGPALRSRLVQKLARGEYLSLHAITGYAHTSVICLRQRQPMAARLWLRHAEVAVNSLSPLAQSVARSFLLAAWAFQTYRESDWHTAHDQLGKAIRLDESAAATVPELSGHIVQLLHNQARVWRASGRGSDFVERLLELLLFLEVPFTENAETGIWSWGSCYYVTPDETRRALHAQISEEILGIELSQVLGVFCHSEIISAAIKNRPKGYWLHDFLSMLGDADKPDGTRLDFCEVAQASPSAPLLCYLIERMGCHLDDHELEVFLNFVSTRARRWRWLNGGKYSLPDREPAVEHKQPPRRLDLRSCTPSLHLQRFAAIVAPTPPAEFVTAIWPSRSHFTDEAGQVIRDLMQQACFLGIDSILNLPRLGATRAHYPNSARPAETNLADSSLKEAFLSLGATVYLQHLDSRFLRSWRNSLEIALGLGAGTVRINAFLSPPGKGLDWHRDDHEMFIVQIHGKKSWRVESNGACGDVFAGRQSLKLKLTASDMSTENLGHAPREYIEVLMTPGSVLFLPRDRAHTTKTLETSLHLVISVPLRLDFDLVPRTTQSVRNCASCES